MNIRKKINKNFLLEEYENNKKSLRIIAKQIICSPETIRKYLKKFNIPIRANNYGKGYEKYQKSKYPEKEIIINGYIRKLLKWKNFRLIILKRDNYICQICKNEANEIHHIKPRKDFPELCWEKNNIISICKKCHLKIEYMEWRR